MTSYSLPPGLLSAPPAIVASGGFVRLPSPFDPSTSSHNPPGDSDCGSSSGVGGMKTNEQPSSDEGGSSSSNGEVVAPPAKYAPMRAPLVPVMPLMAAGQPPPQGPPPPPPPQLPMAPLGPPTMGGLAVPGPPMGGPQYYLPPPGPPLSILTPQPTTPQSLAPCGSDLFVHVQAGETLSVQVGNDGGQNITGPATVRMFGENGAPTALPLHVPPGHLVHQIVDEQGILRHLILSPEIPGPPHFVPPTNGTTPRVHSGKWAALPEAMSLDGAPEAETSSSHHMHVVEEPPEEPTEMEPEECERVKEMLSRIQPPKLIRVVATEVDLMWQELDTSEASATGGPFPQFDPSEFSYQIVLYEVDRNQKNFISSYRVYSRCEPETGNKLRLCRLRPNTEYIVQLKASLEERGLHGEPSQSVTFKTFKGRPDVMGLPRLASRSSDSLTLTWKPPHDNGSPISGYVLYMSRPLDRGEDGREKVWTGKAEDATITGLAPSTAYRFRVAALNEYGEGQESSPVHCRTAPNAPPSRPTPPNIAQHSPTNVRVTWHLVPEQTYTLELHDLITGNFHLSRERTTISETVIPDLRPGGEYRFRLVAHNDEGTSEPSDWTPFRLAPPTLSYAQPPPPPPQPIYQSAPMRPMPLLPQIPPPMSHNQMMPPPVALPVPNPNMQQQQQHIPHHPSSTSSSSGHHSSHSHQSSNSHPQHPLPLNGHGQSHGPPSSSNGPVHTQPHPRRQPERIPVPSKPFVLNNNSHDKCGGARKRLELAWKIGNNRDRSYQFVLEGALEPVNGPIRWKVLYRGYDPQALITEEGYSLFRVQSVFKKSAYSDWSEVLHVPLPDPIANPTQLPPPLVEALSPRSVIAKWKEYNSQLPSTAATIYELRRLGSPSTVIYTGPRLDFRFDGLKQLQRVELQVRAVVTDGSKDRYEGPWSETAAVTTPSDAPPQPVNLRLNANETELQWDFPTTIEARFFATIEQGADIHDFETQRPKLVLPKLQPATTYKFQVTARNEGGDSTPSDFLVITTKATEPSAPKAVSLNSVSTSSLMLAWQTPQSNGSPILNYIVDIVEDLHRKGVEDVELKPREYIVLPSTEEENEYHFEELQADTSYRVRIYAQNAVGRSETVKISARTKNPPPDPPRLMCDPEATQLKLRWRRSTTSTSTDERPPPISFRVVRLNESGGQMPVYEGDLCTAKVKGLAENTEYRFQIRAHDRRVGNGPWSEIFVFKTLVAPPPSVRQAPTATLVSEGLYTVEWLSVIPKQNPRQLIYRLQVVECAHGDPSECSWVTVYEGTVPSYSLRLSASQAAIQARVIVARGEMHSTPSPRVHIANRSGAATEPNGVITQSASAKAITWEKAREVYKVIADHSFATFLVVSLVVFVVVSFTLALFLDSFFGNQPAPKPLNIDRGVGGVPPRQGF